jgi:hypothetical protein
VDQQDSILGGFLFLSFGPLADFSLFPIVLDFRKFLSVDIITLFTLVLLRPLGGVIVVWFFSLLYFTLFPFVTKRGSNFDLDRDCIFNRSSDFCPRMAKGGVC